MNLKGRTVRVQYQHPIRDTHPLVVGARGCRDGRDASPVVRHDTCHHSSGKAGKQHDDHCSSRRAMTQVPFRLTKNQVT